MRPRMTKEEKKIRAAVDKAYILAFNGVPVDALRLPELFREIREAVLQTIRNGDGVHLARRLQVLRAEYGELDPIARQEQQIAAVGECE